MIRYLQLVRPPTPKLQDTLIYVLICLLTGILAIPISILRKRTLRQSISIVFTSLIPKDLLIEFMGARFIARKGKADILLLNNLSSPWMWDYFTPKDGDVVVDIGAHVGKYALIAAKRVGKEGKVIAIEAHAENFKALLNNIRLNDFQNVIALNVAAFSENGKTLRLFGQWDTSYSLKSWDATSTRVETRTTDSILKQYGIRNADWVKIDVEGAETDVLVGMKKTIENSPNLKILVEVNRSNEHEVDRILRGFKKKCIRRPDIFYWKD